MTAPVPDETKQRTDKPRRLLRWLLGTLAVFVVGTLLLFGYRYQQQMALIERIEAAGGEVDTEPWGPEWLRSVIGEDRMIGLGEIVDANIAPEDRPQILKELTQHSVLNLWIRGGVLNSEDAESFRDIGSLSYLWLIDCEAISDEIFPALLENPKLARLGIDHCPISYQSLDHLKSLPLLSRLWLSSVSFYGEPGEASKSFPRLITLDCQLSSLTDDGLKGLGSLGHLSQDLILDGTRVMDEGLIFLRNLKKLTGLSLGDTDVSDSSLQHFSDLQNLEGLALSGTRVTGQGLLLLAQLKNLKRLFLSECQITDVDLAFLEPLTDLETLDLSDTPITDVGLKTLVKQTNLRDLYLIGTQVTAEGVDQLRTKLPKCKIYLQEKE